MVRVCAQGVMEVGGRVWFWPGILLQLAQKDSQSSASHLVGEICVQVTWA